MRVDRTGTCHFLKVHLEASDSYFTSWRCISRALSYPALGDQLILFISTVKKER